MAKIIAFSNQKGGVGKTTSCVNIAAAVAKRGKNVLLIDMDPQGNATTGVNVSKRSAPHNVYEVIVGACTANEALVRTNYKNLWTRAKRSSARRSRRSSRSSTTFLSTVRPLSA